MIGFSPRLSFYLGRQFLVSIGLIFFVLLAIIMLFDALEIIRRSFAKDVPISIMIEMILMKQPSRIQKMIGFAILLGSILCFSRLTKSSELIVARASGISAWQFLSPAFIISFTIGILMVTVFNPLSSITLSRFEQIEAKYLRGNASMLAFSSSGLWLRQQEKTSQKKAIIHALRVSHQDHELHDVTFFLFDKNDAFSKRIDAPKALLKDGQWLIKNAKLTTPGKEPFLYPEYRLPTPLTLHQIQDSFAPPETISFWHLPRFITTLKGAGFSALRHRLHLQTLLALPFFLCAMVFIAATFSLRSQRLGKTGLLLSGGILTGFFIHFLSDFIAAIGLSGSIPVVLAAWSPVVLSILLGIVLMLHFEDG